MNSSQMCWQHIFGPVHGVLYRQFEREPSLHIGPHIQSAHLCYAVSKFVMWSQHIFDVKSAHLWCAVSSFVMCSQHICDVQSVHLWCAVSSFMLCSQHICDMQSAHLLCAGSTFVMWRVRSWNSTHMPIYMNICIV